MQKFKFTVKKPLKLDSYPIPKIKDLFSTLEGELKCIKVDMT